ncbi:MAG: TIGR02301 family protein [Roseiarcus sp.]
MKRPGARLCAACIALALAVSPLAAQTPPAKPAAPAEQPAPAPEPPPPYEPQLMRLAEVMGALSYLRDLCGDGDGATFRAKFGALLETEANTPGRKETLAGAFNRGLRDYEMTYHACTPAAREIVARFLDEAARIAKDVANRYAG